jgi:putative protein-disulfide isomerase
MSTTLHYIYDPLCGWCYGAEPLVNAAREVEDLELQLHGGGLWPRPTQLPEETRRYIQQADARIADMSGQPFGPAYLDGLLLDANLVLDSKPTTAAVLAAQSLDAGNTGKALAMLKGIQHAHYEHGRRVVEREVLCSIAEEIGLDRAAFSQALHAADAEAHIAATQALMARVGCAGFPTFVLQVENKLFGVSHQEFASDPASFGAWLRHAIHSPSTTNPGRTS